MDFAKILSELRSERQQIEEAILVLQRLATSGGKRMGRPPKWMAQAGTQDADAAPAIRKKRVFSAATRKKMAAAQKKRWAAVKE